MRTLAAPPKLRQAYWSLRGLVRRRRLAFCVSAPGTAATDAAIRCGGAEHADIAARMAALRGHDAEEYRARLLGGHLLIYAVAADGTPQSWGWATAPLEAAQDAPWEFGIGMRVSPGSGFLWDYFTIPECRGRGLYRQVLRASAGQCVRRGARRVWGYADVTNAASRRGLMAADYVDAVEIELRRLGPLCRVSGRGLQRTLRLNGVIALDDIVSCELARP